MAMTGFSLSFSILWTLGQLGPRFRRGWGSPQQAGIFQVLAGDGTWKIRKCIDTCIACRLAERLKSLFTYDVEEMKPYVAVSITCMIFSGVNIDDVEKGLKDLRKGVLKIYEKSIIDDDLDIE